MRNLIIDERIRKTEYDYLSKYFNVIKLPLSEDVYEEISGHSDIFYANIYEKIIAAPNAPIIKKEFIIGNSIVRDRYPFDVPYNVCQIGNFIIGSKHADKNIPINISVKQGYTKCSITVTGNNSCITTDIGIAKILKEKNMDVLYVEENNIKLLKDNKFSDKKGFIGGASLLFDNKLILFGDINKLENKNKILEHLKMHNLQLIDFKGLDIIDYGGGTIC